MYQEFVGRSKKSLIDCSSKEKRGEFVLGNPGEKRVGLEVRERGKEQMVKIIPDSFLQEIEKHKYLEKYKSLTSPSLAKAVLSC